MPHKIPYTTVRSGIFYVQFWRDNQLIKNSLRTDSAKQARRIMTYLTPYVVSCSDNKASVEDFKKAVKGVTGMKDDKTLIDEWATAETILRLSANSVQDRYELLTESPSHSPEEIIEEATNLQSCLDDPKIHISLYQKLVSKYLSKPENIQAIQNGEKTESELKKEAAQQANLLLDIIKTQLSSTTFNDEQINQIQTRYNTQATKAYAELTSRYNTVDIPNTNQAEKTSILLSKLHQEHREYKIKLYKTKSKSDTLTSENNKTLRRQNKYYMKFLAVAGDIDISSTKKGLIFDSLIKLFDWPNENQKGSSYNTKCKANKEKAMTQDWYDAIAIDLDEIAEDESIEKSGGTVDEVLGWLQELYKYATEKEYISSSPVTQTNEEYRIRVKQAKRIRTAFSSEEISHFLRYVTETNPNHPMKWPVILMCYTGCRNSELYRITKKDINLETKSIYIDGTKTAAAKRHIPLAKGLEQKGFLEFIKDKEASEPILKESTPFHLLNQELLKISKELNIPETKTEYEQEAFRSFYSFRKSFRTYATHACSNSDLIEVLIGHKVAGNSTKLAYQDATLLATVVEPLRPIVDGLPW